MHPVGDRQEQAAIRRQSSFGAEDVLQRRCPGAVGMDALADLGQLVGIAEEDDRPGRRAGRHRVGERLLARFVDEQDVDAPLELRAGEQPAGPGDDIDRPIGKGLGDLGVRRLGHLGQLVGRLAPSIRCRARSGTPASRAASTVSRSRFVMALCAWAEMPTRRPARTSSTIIRPPGVRLAGPGRTLDGQDRLGLGQADGDPPAACSTVSPGSTSAPPSARPAIRGDRPSRRSRTARYGPSPSMPPAMTESASLPSASRMALLSSGSVQRATGGGLSTMAATESRAGRADRPRVDVTSCPVSSSHRFAPDRPCTPAAGTSAVGCPSASPVFRATNSRPPSGSDSRRAR